MATVIPVHSLRSRRDLAAPRDDLEIQHFLTIRQVGLMLTLGAALWAAVLAPFLF